MIIKNKLFKPSIPRVYKFKFLVLSQIIPNIIPINVYKKNALNKNSLEKPDIKK